VTTGAKWAYGLVNGLLGWIAALALVVFLAAAFTLPHVEDLVPTWLGPVLVGLLVLGAFGEGAYREWRAADTRATSAEGALGETTSRNALATRLDEWAKDCARFQDAIADRSAGPPSVQRMAGLNDDYNTMVAEVRKDLRRHAPELWEAWEEHPSDVPWPLPMTDIPSFRRLFKFSEDQLIELAQRLRDA
jgi:hypothetical protein